MESSRIICFWVTLVCIPVNVLFSIPNIHTSALHFEKSSFHHKKWLMVNLTCFETKTDSEKPTELTKRSISSDKQLRNEATLKGDSTLSGTLNDSEYKISKNYHVNKHLAKHKTKDKEHSEIVTEDHVGSENHEHVGLENHEHVGLENHEHVGLENHEHVGLENHEHVGSEDHEHVGPENHEHGILNDSSNQTETNNSVKVSLDINCNHLKLDADVVEPSVKHLKVTSTGQLDITSEWASNLTKLVFLKIKSDKGITIPQDCSWLPPLLHTLDLAYTPLKKISFSECPHNLKRISLQGSSLEDLSTCLKHLEELDASWNMLSGAGVKLQCKGAAKNLKNLKLHNNYLTSWSSCGFPSITNLELQNNEISNISFSKCPSRELVQINLSNNKFVEPPASYPHRLISINLSHNLLRKTSHFNRGVQEIDLSHNFLTAIAHGTFRATTQLLSLDLSHNQLTVIYGHDFIGCTALRELDLSHNALTHVRNEAFQPLRYILTLRIDHNSLHRLDARLLAGLPKNLQFHASSNPWRCSCHSLAAIKKASTAHCKPKCHDLPELTCREGDTEVSVDNVLRQCIEAIQGFDSKGTVHVLPHDGSSDEDISEEKRDAPTQHLYTAIPLTILILIGLPLLVLGTRKLYRKRNSIKQCCGCLAPSSSSNGRQWSAQQMHDTDSETEF